MYQNRMGYYTVVDGSNGGIVIWHGARQMGTQLDQDRDTEGRRA